MAKKPSNPLVAPADDREWRARAALDTITRAHEHMGDKGLMRDVRKLAEKSAAVVKAPKKGK